MNDMNTNILIHTSKSLCICACAADMVIGPRGLVTSAGPRTAPFGTATSLMLKYLCFLTLNMAKSCLGSTERVSVQGQSCLIPR